MPKVMPNPSMPTVPSLSNFRSVTQYLAHLSAAIWQVFREHAQAINTASVDAPFPLFSATVTTLPAAADYTGCIIYVSDGTSNKRLAVSDGTNWRFPDGNIVS